ncbi:membrane protein [Caldimonas brevitalea]|uniref:Membrane protein n=1 Tax=Caldimonas brevitalea TaxID=413882 RepID=A0A0G3BNB7_9BURK|nr:membrane protein [Caldimonas brevitalea]
MAANRQLGAVLAFVAGGINAGGFLAVHRYTSHVTGVVSAVADHLVLGQLQLALAGLTLLATFMLGATATALLANWARRRRMHSEYALSLMLEAVLLLVFGLLGSRVDATGDGLMPATVLLLSFVMGLQNAVVTKLSRAEIRTTHMTGIVTDLGIELGRALYWNRTRAYTERQPVRANRERLALHTLILSMFLSGGCVGALAFNSMGFGAAVPFAVLLCVMAALPVLDDLRARRV